MIAHFVLSFYSILETVCWVSLFGGHDFKPVDRFENAKSALHEMQPWLCFQG